MSTTTPFLFYFGIVAQFLNLKKLLIFPLKQEGRISQRCVKAEVVAHSRLYVNQQAACDLKSPKMSDTNNKQSNHRLMNVLCRTKAIFADFSKSSK